MATLLQRSITLGSLLFPQNFKIYLLPVIQSKSFSSDYKKIQLNTIEDAIQDIKDGKIIIVVDDENRENEGDFVAARILLPSKL